MSAGRNSFTSTMDTRGLDAYLDQLGDSADKALRPAAQAGAQVLYSKVKANVGALGRRTGKLDGAIYQAYSASNSNEHRAEYHVSWNAKKAPHGHLVEYGYLQRYRYRPDGMGPMVRPGMDGRRKPGRRASQAEKNAYYVTLPSPIQVPARYFVRGAASEFDKAYEAAEKELLRRILEKKR